MPFSQRNLIILAGASLLAITALLITIILLTHQTASKSETPSKNSNDANREEQIQLNKEERMLITLDKTEYRAGELVKITIKNELETPIWYAKKVQCGTSFFQIKSCEETDEDAKADGNDKTASTMNDGAASSIEKDDGTTNDAETNDSSANDTANDENGNMSNDNTQEDGSKNIPYSQICEWFMAQHGFTKVDPGASMGGEWDGMIMNSKGDQSVPAAPGCYKIVVPYSAKEKRSMGEGWGEDRQDASSEVFRIKAEE